MEIWKDISGYEGKYQVSNMGRVLSLNYNKTGKPKLLKNVKNHWGYNEVSLNKNNIRKTCLIITLVAEHFLVKPAPDMIAMHIGDVTDDSVENIAYGYRSEVLHLAYKKGRRKKGNPTKNFISYKGKQYCKWADLAKDYGITGKLLDKRIRRGWTLEESLEIPINRKEFMLRKKLYEYKGKLYSIKQLSELARMSERTLYKRLRRGWSVEEAVEIPLCKNRKVV